MRSSGLESTPMDGQPDSSVSAPLVPFSEDGVHSIACAAVLLT